MNTYASGKDVRMLASRMELHAGVDDKLKILDVFAGAPVLAFEMSVRCTNNKNIWQVRAPELTAPGSVAALAQDAMLHAEHPFLERIQGTLPRGHAVRKDTYRRDTEWFRAIEFRDDLLLAALAIAVADGVVNSFYAPTFSGDWVKLTRDALTSPVFVYTTSEPEAPELSGLLA